MDREIAKELRTIRSEWLSLVKETAKELRSELGSADDTEYARELSPQGTIGERFHDNLLVVQNKLLDLYIQSRITEQELEAFVRDLRRPLN